MTAKYWHSVHSDGLHLTDFGHRLGQGALGQVLRAVALRRRRSPRLSSSASTRNTFMPMLAKYNVTTLCAPPTIYRMMIKEDLSAVRFFHHRPCHDRGRSAQPGGVLPVRAGDGAQDHGRLRADGDHAARCLPLGHDARNPAPWVSRCRPTTSTCSRRKASAPNSANPAKSSSASKTAPLRAVPGVLPGRGADARILLRRRVPHGRSCLAGRGRLLLVCWPPGRRDQILRLPDRAVRD